jgi:hypothetical protein
MRYNVISPSLELIKVGIRTNQTSRRLRGWRKVTHLSVRYTMGIGVIYLCVRLFILLAY